MTAILAYSDKHSQVLPCSGYTAGFGDCKQCEAATQSCLSPGPSPSLALCLLLLTPPGNEPVETDISFPAWHKSGKGGKPHTKARLAHGLQGMAKSPPHISGRQAAAHFESIRKANLTAGPAEQVFSPAQFLQRCKSCPGKEGPEEEEPKAAAEGTLRCSSLTRELVSRYPVAGSAATLAAQAI